MAQRFAWLSVAALANNVLLDALRRVVIDKASGSGIECVMPMYSTANGPISTTGAS